MSHHCGINQRRQQHQVVPVNDTAQRTRGHNPGEDSPITEVQSPQSVRVNRQFLLPRRLYLYGLMDFYRATEELQEEFKTANCDGIEEDRDTLYISTEQMREPYFKARYIVADRLRLYREV